MAMFTFIYHYQKAYCAFRLLPVCCMKETNTHQQSLTKKNKNCRNLQEQRHAQAHFHTLFPLEPICSWEMFKYAN